LTRAKKYKEAKKVFREDLKIQPNNSVSVRGLQAIPR
jgi:hypothetical protein